VFPTNKKTDLAAGLFISGVGFDPLFAQRFLPQEVIDTSEHLYRPLYKDKEFLLQKYEVERLSVKEIAASIGSSRTAVSSNLKLFGIAIRPTDLKNKSRLGFGEAWRQHRVALHKKEQELIEKMQKLRAEGLSYWKVADVLNAWGVPTKTRKGIWSAKQVHQILRRVNAQASAPPKGDQI
jgi:predicted DNA-binding protein YlxM (UPF0122 family)